MFKKTILCVKKPSIFLALKQWAINIYAKIKQLRVLRKIDKKNFLLINRWKKINQWWINHQKNIIKCFINNYYPKNTTKNKISNKNFYVISYSILCLRNAKNTLWLVK